MQIMTMMSTMYNKELCVCTLLFCAHEKAVGILNGDTQHSGIHNFPTAAVNCCFYDQ